VNKRPADIFAQTNNREKENRYRSADATLKEYMFYENPEETVTFLRAAI